jgi:hypothetical protein
MVGRLRNQLGQGITMSASRSPLEYLKQFRQLLVEERRSVIFNFFELRTANRQDNTPTSLVHRHGAEVQKLQEEIEAVDRAIKDEEALSE